MWNPHTATTSLVAQVPPLPSTPFRCKQPLEPEWPVIQPLFETLRKGDREERSIMYMSVHFFKGARRTKFLWAEVERTEANRLT